MEITQKHSVTYTLTNDEVREIVKNHIKAKASTAIDDFETDLHIDPLGAVLTVTLEDVSRTG